MTNDLEVPNYPQRVAFILSDKCNFKCIFCTHSVQTFSNIEVPINKIKEMSDLIINVKVVGLSAHGEFILHSEFAEYLDFMKEMGKPFNIVSNGYAFTDELIEKIKDSTVNQVVISLNAMNKETHAKLHGASEKCFDRIIENIHKLSNKHNEKISRICKTIGVEGNVCLDKKYVLVLSFVATRYNFRQIKSLIDFAKIYDLIVCITDLNYAHEFFYEPNLRVADTKENREYLEECKQYAKEQNVIFHLVVFSFDQRQDQEKPIHKDISKCRVPWEELIIGITGMGSTCCYIRGLDWEVITVDKTWRDVWNGKALNKLRQCILNNDDKFCQNCLLSIGEHAK